MRRCLGKKQALYKSKTSRVILTQEGPLPVELGVVMVILSTDRRSCRLTCGMQAYDDDLKRRARLTADKPRCGVDELASAERNVGRTASIKKT